MSEIAIYRQFAGEGPAALACVCAPPHFYEQFMSSLSTIYGSAYPMSLDDSSGGVAGTQIRNREGAMVVSVTMLEGSDSQREVAHVETNKCGVGHVGRRTVGRDLVRDGTRASTEGGDSEATG